MFKSKIIDTFPAFEAFWEQVKDQSIDIQLGEWKSGYLAGWPELLEMQIRSYTEDGEDWRQVALERIVPFWQARLPSMRCAHEILMIVCDPVCQSAQKRLGYRQPLSFVLYVGVGCGAGWATTYENKAAILLGLENIAEEGWETEGVLRGLLAHEIGNLWHIEQRKRSGLEKGVGPWWQLYTEGLAQRCEREVSGEGSWHMASGKLGWLEWCQAEKQWLAEEYLRRVALGGRCASIFWFMV